MLPRKRFAALLAVAVVFTVITIAPAVWAPAQSASQSAKAKVVPAPEDRTDINHASMAQLLKVPGMTDSWAGRIVRFRPYRTKQDLVDRGVLPADVYDRIKDFVIAHRDKQ